MLAYWDSNLRGSHRRLKCYTANTFSKEAALAKNMRHVLASDDFQKNIATLAQPEIDVHEEREFIGATRTPPER